MQGCGCVTVQSYRAHVPHGGQWKFMQVRKILAHASRLAAFLQAPMARCQCKAFIYGWFPACSEPWPCKRGFVQAACGWRMSRSAFHTALLHLKPPPKPSCHRRSPLRTPSLCSMLPRMYLHSHAHSLSEHLLSVCFLSALSVDKPCCTRQPWLVWHRRRRVLPSVG